MTMTTFEFVLLDPQSNLKPGKNSSQIRSRCMQGKNKRAGSRRSRKEGKKLSTRDRNVVEQSHAPANDDVQTQAVLQLTSVAQAFDLLSRPRLTDWEIQFNQGGIVLEAFAYDLTNKSFSPFDCCVDFESIAGHIVPFDKLRSEQVLMHSILATGCALHDFSILGNIASPIGQSVSPTRKTLQHLQSTVSLLRMKLQDPYAYRDESIIHAVLNLAMLAGGYRQWAASIAHLNGLKKIIQLNGGSEFLARWPKLRFKLDRIDLVWCLSSGKDPLFTQAPESWEPILYLPKCRIAPSNMRLPSTKWSTPLAAAFADLQTLSLRINSATRARSRYDATDFCGVLTSLQTRLLYLRRSTRSLGLYKVPQFPYINPIAIDIEDPFQELMRLFMLAFLTTTFKALGNNMPFQWIGAQVAEIVPKVLKRRDGDDDDFLLWGLAIAGLSVVDPEEGWFRQAWWEVAPGQGWGTIRERLVRVLWVEVAHDAIGEAMFDKALSIRD